MLTDKKVKAFKANGKDELLNDGNGLFLRVRATTQSKSWLVRYKENGKTTRLTIGNYPAMTLAEARIALADVNKKRLSGDTPLGVLKAKQAKRSAQQNEPRIANFKALFDDWKDKGLARRKDKGASVCAMFQKDVFPFIGDKAITDVTKADVSGIIDRICGRGAKVLASHVLGALKQMFRFAESRDHLDKNPIAVLSNSDFGFKKIERERVLSEDEIVELSEKLPDANFTKSTELAIWIMLSTACRVGELSRARWDEIKFEEKSWLIPPANAKNGRALEISMSDFSAQCFRELKKINGTSDWCYPASRTTEHVSLKSLSKQIRDRQRVTPMKNRSSKVGTLVLSGGEWTPHDLRRTAATLMTSMGVFPEVIERCINHVEQNRMKRIYQRHEYKEEMKDAWKQLGDKLAGLVKVPLVAAA